MSAWQRKLIALCGLLGPVILTAGCVVAAIPYRGEKGEVYSALNHFISELGFVGVSSLAPVFNACQTTSGLLIALFMAGLGRHFRTKLACAAAASGVVSGTLCSLLGQIPMNDLPHHLKTAFAFFGSGLLTVALFSLVLVRDRENKLPKWLLVPGLIAFAGFVLLLAYPPLTRQTLADLIRIYRTARPDIWLVAILEWLMIT